MTTKIRLPDLPEAEIRPMQLAGEKMQALWFECPVCRAHKHAVPFRAGPHGVVGGMHVWQHVGGDTLADLTLAPSYLSRSPRNDIGKSCRLHVFVRGGLMEVLGDSGLVEGQA